MTRAQLIVLGIFATALSLAFTSPALAQTYCNGTPMYDSGGRLYPNGQRIQDPWGRALYPDGSRAADEYGYPLYPNGERIRDIYKRYLYPGGVVLRDQLKNLYWPNGQMASGPYSGCYNPKGESIPCGVTVGLGVDFDGIVVRLNLNLTVSDLDASEVEFWVGPYQARYEMSVQNGKASSIRFYCD